MDNNCVKNYPDPTSPIWAFSSLKIVTVLWCMSLVFHWAEYTKVTASLKYRETIGCTKRTTIKVWGIIQRYCTLWKYYLTRQEYNWIDLNLHRVILYLTGNNRDGVHLTRLGNDFFLNTLQGALYTFMYSFEHVFPQFQYAGPWLDSKNSASSGCISYASYDNCFWNQ